MERKKKRLPKPLQRKIHIGASIWTYSVRKNYVQIRTPDLNQTYKIDFPILTGLSWNEIERSHWKKTNGANITPSMIKKCILKILIRSYNTVIAKYFDHCGYKLS